MKKSKLLFLSILAIASLALTACTKAGDTNSVSNGNDNAQSIEPTEPSPAPTQTPLTEPSPAPSPSPTQAPAAGATEISVVGTEYSFNPKSINVKTGERVKITFKNNGRAPHNLTLEGLGIGTKTIGGGQTDVVEFTAPSSGTYAFFCSVPGHRAAGMEGNLKVE